MSAKDHLISQYIDDELDLFEKRDFLVELKEDQDFSDEAIALVEQEIRLFTDPVFKADPPPKAFPAPRRFWRRAGPALALAASVAVFAAVVLCP
jgi:ferric-dicitrate binding protein FerR (iron transport regulator)